MLILVFFTVHSRLRHLFWQNRKLLHIPRKLCNKVGILRELQITYFYRDAVLPNDRLTKIVFDLIFWHVKIRNTRPEFISLHTPVTGIWKCARLYGNVIKAPSSKIKTFFLEFSKETTLRKRNTLRKQLTEIKTNHFFSCIVYCIVVIIAQLICNVFIDRA